MPDTTDPKRFFSPEYLAEHPGLGESMIPVWGSAREAYADYQDGDMIGAGLKSALAATDVFLAKAGLEGAVKGIGYLTKIGRSTATDPTSWKNVVRPWMGKQGYFAPGQQGHHWLIPQRVEGGKAFNALKNSPANIKPMPVDEPIVHRRLHGRAQTPAGDWLPRFNPIQRYLHGTPTWWKAANASTTMHPAGAVKRWLDDEQPDDDQPN